VCGRGPLDFGRQQGLCLESGGSGFRARAKGGRTTRAPGAGGSRSGRHGPDTTGPGGSRGRRRDGQGRPGTGGSSPDPPNGADARNADRRDGRDTKWGRRRTAGQARSIPSLPDGNGAGSRYGASVPGLRGIGRRQPALRAAGVPVSGQRPSDRQSRAAEDDGTIPENMATFPVSRPRVERGMSWCL
jgi:hypothetical protein